MMQKGDVSSTEVVSAHLERIHAVNPALNAIVTLVSDHALEMAAAADDRKAAGEALGLLHGLPIAHKDLADTAGIRTTLGSTLMSDRVPTRNALVVERAVDAGAVTMGKTNTPEFGAGSQTFNDVFGPTLNPYDLTRTCGGSSGGAAVAACRWVRHGWLTAQPGVVLQCCWSPPFARARTGMAEGPSLESFVDRRPNGADRR